MRTFAVREIPVKGPFIVMPGTIVSAHLYFLIILSDICLNLAKILV